MALIAPSRRVRRTPFSEGVEAAGVHAYSVYNRMLLPAVFRSLEEDYRHLKEAVQVWDVSVERQVEIRGPDAARLMQRLTPRDLTKMAPGMCYYVPTVDQTGGMLNDPVALMIEPDRFWVSIADSDLLMWVKGLAHAWGMDVTVEEPDVSPLAIQGPKADDLAAAVFGDAVRELKFFRFARFEFAGQRHVMSRSGYSKQGGFEIYVEGTENGMPLWNALMEAGRAMDVHAGCPNLIERIEGGLLSYGNDMTRENTPYECGLGKFCAKAGDIDCIGQEALVAAAALGPAREIRAVAIEGRVPACDRPWPVTVGGDVVGQVTSAAWSPDFDTSVAIGMIGARHWQGGTAVEVQTQDGARPAIVRDRFWN